MGNVRCTDGAAAADVTTTPSGKASRKQQSRKRCAPSSHRALLLTGPSELPASATLLRSARQVNPVDPHDPPPVVYPGRLSVRSGRPGAQPCFLLRLIPSVSPAEAETPAADDERAGPRSVIQRARRVEAAALQLCGQVRRGLADTGAKASRRPEPEAIDASSRVPALGLVVVTSSQKLCPNCAPSRTRPSGRFMTKGPQLQAFCLVGETGFEPATARPPAGCATRLRHSPWHPERATGIEPALEAWKASVQPQHFARKRHQGYLRSTGPCGAGATGSGAALLGGHRAAIVGQGRRWPGPEPVVGGAVEGDHRAAQRVAERAREQRDEPAELLHGA